MVDHISILSRSPGFPEASFPISHCLKKLLKNVKNGGIRKDLTKVVEMMDASVKEVSAARESLTEAQMLEKFQCVEKTTLTKAADTMWEGRRKKEAELVRIDCLFGDFSL